MTPEIMRQMLTVLLERLRVHTASREDHRDRWIASDLATDLAPLLLGEMLRYLCRNREESAHLGAFDSRRERQVAAGIAIGKLEEEYLTNPGVHCCLSAVRRGDSSLVDALIECVRHLAQTCELSGKALDAALSAMPYTAIMAGKTVIAVDPPTAEQPPCKHEWLKGTRGTMLCRRCGHSQEDEPPEWVVWKLIRKQRAAEASARVAEKQIGANHADTPTIVTKGGGQ